MPRIGHCYDCAYWDRSGLDETGEQVIAPCIRRAPKMDFRSGQGCWPTTDENEACGEFAQDPDTDS